MNQIKRKRRLSALEAAVLGNILYIVIVLIFKNIFDLTRTSNFDYLFNGIQLITIGAFWIILFTVCFKNISGNEKPKTLRYVVYSLIPIIVLTGTLTVVSTMFPGQDTNSIWNQFAFIAAPTIFWYLPFGLIYQLVGGELSVFLLFGIALVMTIVFQVIGIVLGRIVGRKYWEETKAEDQRDLEYDLEAKKEKKKNRRKSRGPKRESIGLEGLSNEQINEGFTPRETEIMTEVIIDDTYVAPERGNVKKTRFKKSETGLFETNEPIIEEKPFGSEKVSLSYESEIKPAAMPDIATDTEFSNEPSQTAGEWNLSQPIELENLNKGLNQHEESDDKSFLMETSAVRIINEEDIEAYYRNKK
ncbi:MAG: hypothetical protein BI182_06180 [Acetobacterium sp. MES1]|uniref:hypothetical protein n=1 Tax=unclassified Acetobacterium TaxID=2638182 RepID=UPI000B9CBCFC|nr:MULTISPECIES: hypothetical protein [unclassified Acetobacterium]OXS26329.1 MAG: hypothetical protein BI182_06180 [Acetobacterium sp. MES1]